MALGDYTMLKKYRDPIVAMDGSGGTTIYVLFKSGQLSSYTIAGGASAVVSHIRGNVKCMLSPGTYLYLGMGDGRLIRYTIATKVNSEIKRFDCAIHALSIYSNVLYVATSDGRLHSYALA